MSVETPLTKIVEVMRGFKIARLVPSDEPGGTGVAARVVRIEDDGDLYLGVTADPRIGASLDRGAYVVFCNETKIVRLSVEIAVVSDPPAVGFAPDLAGTTSQDQSLLVHAVPLEGEYWAVKDQQSSASALYERLCRLFGQDVAATKAMSHATVGF